MIGSFITEAAQNGLMEDSSSIFAPGPILIEGEDSQNCFS
jgi:hypothetical protein